VVDSRYGLTSRGKADLAGAIKSPFRNVYKVKPGDSLQSIATNVYGISASKAHSTYAQLETAISSMNDLSDPNRIAAGQALVVPGLPRMQSAQINAGAPLETQTPSIELGPTRTDILSGSGYDYSASAVLTPGQVTNIGQSRSALVRQTQWLPTSVARKDPNITVLAQPISIDFGQAVGGAADDLTQDIQNLRTYVSAHPAIHQTIMYVLDDSWPDSAAFAESVKFFQQADAKIRQTFNLGSSMWPASLTAPQATTTFPWLTNGGASHAAAIKGALSSFSTVSSSVKVIYVPLFTEQTGAKDLLGEIIFVNLLGHYKQEDLENPVPAQKLQVLTEQAVNVRNQILQSLPAYSSNQPTDTDEAVVTGLLNFAQWYAQISGEPFFLNTSWVVKQYEFTFGPPPGLLGATLAAVGDNPGTDIFATNVLLASHASAFPGDVIAIMNNHPDGSRGNCTSYWTATGQDPVYGLSYDGFLANNVCGTSFSAPRIAWMLALRETRHPLVTDRNAQYQWFQSFRSFILSLQDQTRAGDLRYWFSPAAAMQR
jgi:LysM repeat protein